MDELKKMLQDKLDMGESEVEVFVDRIAERTMEILEAFDGYPIPEKRKYTIETLIDLYNTWGKPDKAAEWWARLVELEAETS